MIRGLAHRPHWRLDRADCEPPLDESQWSALLRRARVGKVDVYRLVRTIVFIRTERDQVRAANATLVAENRRLRAALEALRPCSAEIEQVLAHEPLDTRWRQRMLRWHEAVMAPFPALRHVAPSGTRRRSHSHGATG